MAKLMISDRNEQLRSQAVTKNWRLNDFSYLRSLIIIRVNLEKEIERIILLGRVVMKKLTKTWKDRTITKTTKVRLLKNRLLCVPLRL